MADLGIGEALLISSAITAAASGTSAAVSAHQSEKAEHAQKKAQAKAEAAQIASDKKAEEERLKALAKQQESEAFGIDSTLAARYADAAQKWGAGTGSTKQDEEENPFYTRGLV